MAFANLLGLWALTILVPFIILYLIKPKPIDKVIPSLMFILREEHLVKDNTFLQKLMSNILFLVQLLALTALAISMAAPYFYVPFSATSANTVIIIDGSASMQASYGTTTRFQEALKIAKQNVGPKTSVILVENAPLLLLREGGSYAAGNILDTLKPKATTTNLGDALLLADDILEKGKGYVIVLSDFIPTDGSDILVAKRQLLAKENFVDFRPIFSNVKNIGIVGLDIDDYETKAFVKNYNDEEEKVTVKIISGTSTLAEKEIIIAPDSMENLIFETPPGVSNIQLDIKDGFELDNVAYISAPDTNKAKILLITSEDKSAIESAFRASKNIELSVSNPPLSHMVEGKPIDFQDFDVIALGDVIKEGEEEGILRGRFEDFKRYIEKGGNFIITGQDDLMELAVTEPNKKILADMLPVTFRYVGNGSELCFSVFNKFTKHLEKNPCPAFMNRYYLADAKPNTVTIAESKEKFPVIAYNGNVFYYGVFDGDCDFKSSADYPIFWNELINFILKREEISDYNFRTGDRINIPEQLVETPKAKITTSELILDENGVYQLRGKTIAANLLDEKESDISKENEELLSQSKKLDAGTEKRKKRQDFESTLILFAIALITFELFYIKRRGDL